MNDEIRPFYELRFRAHFLESKGAAFQDLFVSVMCKAHPGDFMPCKPWGRTGDQKNDGYLKSEKTLFQIYAPNELRANDTIRKIQEDFTESLPHWREYFDTWVFVHNAHTGLPPTVIAKLLELELAYAPIKITHWGFEELLLRFRCLSVESLVSLYGSVPQDTERIRLFADRQETAHAATPSSANKPMPGPTSAKPSQRSSPPATPP